MIFSELYSAYYNTVAKILDKAVNNELESGEIRKIIEENAFNESILNIEPAIKNERWQLILPNGKSVIKNHPSMPLTTLQKRWINSISQNPRIRLFTDDMIYYPDVEPLFSEDDYYVFDKYSDGDLFDDEQYIKTFRLILSSIKTKTPLEITFRDRKNSFIKQQIQPSMLEYSEKDDKFRLIGFWRKYIKIINLGRIIDCKPCALHSSYETADKNDFKTETVEFELVDERKALERVLMHFAHFDKQAIKISDNRYKIKVTYEKCDETEIVIRILSFGPMIKVNGPGRFVDLIKKRLSMQKSCGL